MRHTNRTIFREIGTAIAVLSLYVLVLLAPLHQAAGLQRDFDALGFASLNPFSICQPLSVEQAEDLPDVTKCPMSGIGKHEIAVLPPPSIEIAAPDLARLVSYPTLALLPDLMRPPHDGQARAPPVAA